MRIHGRRRADSEAPHECERGAVCEAVPLVAFALELSPGDREIARFHARQERRLSAPEGSPGFDRSAVAGPAAAIIGIAALTPNLSSNDLTKSLSQLTLEPLITSNNNWLFSSSFRVLTFSITSVTLGIAALLS